ncbi:M4 family metallopeptidase [Pseudalkalibacillus decolorationis]|uniref:M4 family metallopeptidase n=1 Tax=Pseudalkalibacillus decolorationis TaxID=163879 RepID=UPI002147A2E5|nr:M4 family metallopeptidase [Pseudalkalibacillus decolorationis]
MKKRKSAALLLTLGLAFSSSMPAFAASDIGTSAQKQVIEKMEQASKDEVQVTWKKGQKVPSFISGKVTKKSIKSKEGIKKFLKENKDLFQLDPKSDLTLLDVKTDDLGMTHYEFAQSVKGVPVNGAELKVHTDENGKVIAVNGDVHPDAPKNLQGNVSANINEDKAIDVAWNSINLSPKETHAENAEENVPFKSTVKNTVEKSKLVIYEKDNNYFLAYKVELQFIYPYPANWKVFVDAKDGSIVDSYNAVADGATTGYGYGVLGDYKELNTYLSGGNYFLYDTTKPMNGVIEVRTAQNGTSLPGPYPVDSNNAFTATSQAAAVDAHYYASQVYDYFYNTHNRNSYDNNGSTIRSTVNYGSNYNNAFWNGSQMVYGDGDGSTFAPLSGALDIVAHELTHAVTDTTANLVYQDQSGALNESMSDVFSVFVEREDYLLGEDAYTPNRSGDALRSLSNPPAYNQPDHMDNYYYTNSDNGGVHTNSGIPNKAGYLTISSIGADKAEKIYYRALTVYLGPYSNFSDARAALLQSAADYYGYGTEYDTIVDSWNQVGVY